MWNSTYEPNQLYNRSASYYSPIRDWLGEGFEDDITKHYGDIYVFTEVDVFNNVHTASFNVTLEELEALDPSAFPFPNMMWLVKPAAEIAWKTSVFIPIVFGGMFLNTIILLTLMRNRWLWSPSNYLIANVAMVDLCTLIFCPWMLLVHDFLQTYSLGKVGCRTEGFVQGTMLLTGVGAVMLISYDRLATVALPVEARITKRTAPKLVAATWGIACVLSLPLAVHRQYRERQWLNYLEIYCVEDINVLPIYWHVLIAALVWFPLSVMLITYGTILWRLEKCSKQLCTTGAGLCVVRARAKAVWTTAAVLVAFIVCKVPFTALVYWRNELLKTAQVNGVEGSFQILWFLAHYLMYLNCAVNPLIYGFTNARYRRAMNKTPFVAIFRFNSWCCVWPCTKTINSKGKVTTIAVIGESPKPKGKMQKIKNMLHVHRDHIDLTNVKTDSFDHKSSKVTRLSPLN